MTKSGFSANSVFGWDHFTVYLSGPIDFDRRGGSGWRDEWTAKLMELGFSRTQIFNPCRKPLPKDTPFDLDDEARIINHHRERHEWSEMCQVMDQIVHVDLRLVDHSDLILANFPCVDGHRVPTYGTMHELVEARHQRKPVYVVWEGGKETCSGWLMWLVGHTNIFATFDELLTRLKNISKGKAAYNAKDWLLLDLDGDGVV